jgi:murein DD-endopeptidase MepM/ murein hydrolase activator NlpD
MRRLAIAAVFLAAACVAQPDADAKVETSSEPTIQQGYGEVFGLKKEVCDSDGNCRFIESTDAETQQMLEQVNVRVAEMAAAYSGINCHGITQQGGMVICRTAPNARVEVGRAENDTYVQTADANGIIIIGFDRDEPAAFARVGEQRVNFTIEPREYDTSIINGLPSNMVNEYSESDLKRIRAATARKKVGFASKVEEIGFKDGFIYPVADHIKTTNFGAQRILNGEPKRPHFGVDLAAPKGTPILAPADGIVSMADNDMYFEGSLILIDHGQGLISYYLHNDEVMVTEGQRVKQGEQIGTVGTRGRSTGPHLCWRLKWRGRNLDPELLTEWPSRG